MVLREVDFLYINEKVKIHPLILGGGQQKGMRSGTDNVPGIAGLGAAAADCYKDFEEKQKKLRALRNYFIEEVEKLPDDPGEWSEGRRESGTADRQRQLRVVCGVRYFCTHWRNGAFMSLPALPALPTRNCR